MWTTAATAPSDMDADNEDWCSTADGVIVVLDGATVRTGTGCRHGTPWFVEQLGMSIATLARDRDRPLTDALGAAIATVAAEHPLCDLSHPGTPAAASGVLRRNGPRLEYTILGDVTMVLDTAGGVEVHSDHRVDGVARAQRATADRLPTGSSEKTAALVAMKRAELAVRNTLGGYWIAAADPVAARHALVSSVPAAAVRRVAVLTDGAARAVTPFGLLDWPALLDLLSDEGPHAQFQFVRRAERGDPVGTRWPRNKCHDDATAVFVDTAVDDPPRSAGN